MLTPVATPAALFDLARAYTVDIARSVGRIAFKNVRRTRDVVDSEYNSGQSGRILFERGWLQEPTLEGFLIGQDAAERMAKVEGQIVRVKTREYYRYRLGALAKLVSDYQTRLFALLDQLEAQNRVRVLARQPTGFAPSLHNDGCCMSGSP